MEEPSRRQLPAPQTPARNKAVIPNYIGSVRGARSLFLSRGPNGFGFTLRHFIVYPPESYLNRAKDSPADERMETIFVKDIWDESTKAAGLATGDRILSVNGEPVEGKSYAAVVQMIQNTADRLLLVVVSKDKDVIQQHYSKDAHNPQTNNRPRRKSPDLFTSGRRDSSVSPAGPRSLLEPIYQSPIYPDALNGGSWTSTPRQAVINSDNLSGSSSPYFNTPGSRLSLDGSRLSSSGGSLMSYDPNVDAPILSRLRKSFEQKEEFLKSDKRPVFPLPREGEVIAREFYARPQRLQQSAWPPEEQGRPTTRAPLVDLQETFADSRTPLLRVQETGQDHRGLPRIREGYPQDRNFGSNSFDSDPGESGEWGDRGAFHRSRSEEKDVPQRRSWNQPQMQVVSQRTRQFESGQLEEDKTNFYKSELARLTQKHAVPAVAVRRQEFEQRSSMERSPRILEVSSPPVLSGNRTCIVGSSLIHVAPPTGYHERVENGIDDRLRRGRSSSQERWLPGSVSSHHDSQSWQLSEPKLRPSVVRQPSYLAAVKTLPGPTAVRTRRLIRRQQSLDSADFKEDFAATSPIVARVRNASPSRIGRRVIAKRPTKLQLATESDASGDEVPVERVPSSNTTTCEVVRRGKSSTSSESSDERTTRRFSYIKATTNETENAKSEETIKDTGKENLKKEGALYWKQAQTDGKRSTDRSWKPILAQIKDSELIIRKDYATEPETVIQLKGCQLDVAVDYTKRKHVLRLRTPADSEFLLQAEDTTSMEQWRSVLEEQGALCSELSNFGTRSPVTQSPVSKSRKSSQHETTPIAKSKTWKGKLGKPWRLMGSGAASPCSPTAAYPEGATIGVPLQICPSWPENPLVPWLVVRCTNIVEAKGLEIIGVYRVPGNTAAITSLTEALNRGIHTVSPEDPRWNDVNVISSLLKSFFRLLPDCLFTGELYPEFIAADKVADQRNRMLVIRDLIKRLPEHNTATLKHLLFHLQKVVGYSEVNKMATKNLAIIFGPTLLRIADLFAFVHDTGHQCRLIESLISNVDWFFSDADANCLELSSLPPPSEVPQVSESCQGANILLGNIDKVCGQSTPKDLFSSLVTAARKKSKKPEKADPPTGHPVKSALLPMTVSKSEQQEHVEMTSSASTIAASKMTATHISGIRAHDQQTLERIQRFKEETAAMLTRDNGAIHRSTQRLSMEGSIGKDSSNGLTRKVGSCESLQEDATSVKRFRSSREDCSSQKFGSLDSLQAHTTDQDTDLLSCLTTYDEKWQVLKSLPIAKDEKERQSKEEKDKDEKEKEDAEKEEKPIIPNVLRTRNGNQVKRSESLNKPDRPEMLSGLKVRRSESLGKADVRRTDSLTKTEKTETNMKAKLKRTSSKEKENKRIKRRHTLGGTKDLDKLPWLDNKLSDALEKSSRTSSPDLSSTRLKLSVDFSNQVQLRSDAVASLIDASVARPTSLPPGSQSYKLPPLESHV